jgi:hypothetical protein
MIATALSTSSTWFASQSEPFEVWYHDQVSLRDLYILISSIKRTAFYNPTLSTDVGLMIYKNQVRLSWIQKQLHETQLLWPLLHSCNVTHLAHCCNFSYFTNMVTRSKSCYQPHNSEGFKISHYQMIKVKTRSSSSPRTMQ